MNDRNQWYASANSSDASTNSSDASANSSDASTNSSDVITYYEETSNKFFKALKLDKPALKIAPSDPTQIRTRFQIDLCSKMKRKDKRTQRIIFAEAAMFAHSMESLLGAVNLKLKNSKAKTLDYINEMITNNRLVHTSLNKIIAINDDGKIDCRLCDDIDGLMTDITEQIGAIRNYMCPICYGHFFDGRWYNKQEYYSYKREAWEVKDSKFDERIDTHRKQDQI